MKIRPRFFFFVGLNRNLILDVAFVVRICILGCRVLSLEFVLCWI